MLEIGFIRENKDIVEAAIKNKHGEPVDLDHLLKLYDDRKELQSKLDEINQKKNEAAQARDVEKGKALKQEGQELEGKLKETTKEFIALMAKLPNIPSLDTPLGDDEDDNVEIRSWGEKPAFSFEPKPHWELGEALGIIDKERAARISGARFAYILGDLALVQFALIDLVFKTLTNKETLQRIADNAGLEDFTVTPFIPVVPPTIVKPEVLNAMGRLEPREDKYHLDQDDMYLVGSAEHSVGSMYTEEILDEKQLPLRYIGYSTSYRREAGSYGKDTKGILRLHQFDKLEMETFTLAGDSFKEQDFLVAIQEYLTQQIKVPHQTMAVCTGDMGVPDQRQFDINMWMPGQGAYKETHTSDLIGAFQARRLNTRVRRASGKTEFVHMNDATAFAIGRTLAAIMENYQQEDGSILIPEILRDYVGKECITN